MPELSDRNVLANGVTVRKFNKALMELWEVFGNEVILPGVYDSCVRRIRNLPVNNYTVIPELAFYNHDIYSVPLDYLTGCFVDCGIDPSKAPTIQEIEARHPGLMWEDYAYGTKVFVGPLFCMLDDEELVYTLEEYKENLMYRTNRYNETRLALSLCKAYYEYRTQGKTGGLTGAGLNELKNYHAKRAGYMGPGDAPDKIVKAYGRFADLLKYA